MTTLDSFIALDLETTGTDPLEARIVELGLCEFILSPQSGLPVKIKPIARLFNPGVPISKSATAVHGITDEHVKDKPRFSQASEKLAMHLSGRVIVGYNLFQFDGPLLKAEFARCGIPRPFDGVVCVDVYPYVKEDYGSKRRPQSKKLTDQCQWWGIGLEKAHSAAHDAESTGRLLLAMQAWKQTVPFSLEQILDEQKHLRAELDRAHQMEISI